GVRMYSRELDQTTVTGPALRLRATAPAEVDWVVAQERRPENRPYVLDWGPERHRALLQNPDSLHLIIEDANGEKAGYAILNGLENAAGSVELMRLVVAQKGQGTGREAILRLMRHFFAQGAHRFWLDVVTGNTGAIALYEKLGFVKEGVLRECLMFNGKRESMQVMSVLAREYRAFGGPAGPGI
ncbi:GNAT family N-acetyltransferase, partial [Ruminococcaceae bacterium OttesenSCG-928-A11]|nr:GNAT family N-acetyltransferase [Ruminococcaceae bacterium OttesenSCG-928-A11]